ncbi:MAG TPA: DUF1453 domain-containing protein [Xanthomonadaceae bacterium]
MASPDLAPYAMVPVIGWLMYRRISRHFGKQRLDPKPVTIRLVILALATLGVTAAAAAVPDALWPVAAGLLGGLAIAMLNLRLTRFEWSQQGDYYYPHPAIGAVLTLLLVARLAYRYTQLAAVSANAGQPTPAAVGQSPMTLALLALLLGYYLAYSIGLLVLRSRHHRV